MENKQILIYLAIMAVIAIYNHRKKQAKIAAARQQILRKNKADTNSSMPENGQPKPEKSFFETLLTDFLDPNPASNRHIKPQVNTPSKPNALAIKPQTRPLPAQKKQSNRMDFARHTSSKLPAMQQAQVQKPAVDWADAIIKATILEKKYT